MLLKLSNYYCVCILLLVVKSKRKKIMQSYTINSVNILTFVLSLKCSIFTSVSIKLYIMNNYSTHSVIIFSCKLIVHK